MLIDLHSDVLADVETRRLRGETSVLSRRYRSRWESAGVSGVLVPVGGDTKVHPMDLPDTVALIHAVQDEVTESDGWLTVARTPSELRKAQKDGQIALVLTLEGAMPFEGRMPSLRLLHDLGLAVIGLTHNYRNELADGVSERRSQGGLTRFGVDVVKAAGDLGMVIDVAHLSDAGIWDVIANENGLVISSHACCRSIRDRARNITDEQMQAIAAIGGIVGLAFIGDFLVDHGGEPTHDELMAHFTHMGDTMGWKHVGVGSDFTDYSPERVAIERAVNPDLGPPAKFPHGIHTIEGLALLEGLLRDAGHPDSVVRGVLGENFLAAWENRLN